MRKTTIAFALLLTSCLKGSKENPLVIECSHPPAIVLLGADGLPLDLNKQCDPSTLKVIPDTPGTANANPSAIPLEHIEKLTWGEGVICNQAENGNVDCERTP